MTTGTTLLVPDDPTTWIPGILAAAELRETRIGLAAKGPYITDDYESVHGFELVYLYSEGGDGDSIAAYGTPTDEAGSGTVAAWLALPDGEYLAGEHPLVAQAGCRRWRRTVERHTRKAVRPMFPQDEFSPICEREHDDWPCEDLRDVAAEAYAYLTGKEWPA